MLKMKLIASFLLIVLTTAMVGGLTGAWFTDTDNAGTATFTAGTLSVDVSDGLGQYNPLLSTPNMMYPGDIFAPITIEIINTGSKDLAWFGNWVFTPQTPGEEKLLDKIYIEKMSMKFFNKDGSTFYDEDIFINEGTSTAYANLLAPEGYISLKKWNDNAGMAPGTVYEHMGALKPGGKYIITVQFGFHKSADNLYQADAFDVSPIDIGFIVDATQVNKEAMNVLKLNLYPRLGEDHFGWMVDQINEQN